MVLVICDGLLKLSPASIVFVSFPRRSSDLFGSLEIWALALRVTVPVRLMMNLLFVLGLRDVSLFSCLFDCQHFVFEKDHGGRKTARLTVVALSDPVLYPSALSQV